MSAIFSAQNTFRAEQCPTPNCARPRSEPQDNCANGFHNESPWPDRITALGWERLSSLLGGGAAMHEETYAVCVRSAIAYMNEQPNGHVFCANDYTPAYDRISPENKSRRLAHHPAFLTLIDELKAV